MDRKFLIKLVITLSLLAYVGIKADWHQIKATISHINIFPFAMSYLILLLCSIPLAIRLRILLKPTVLQFSLKRLIQVQFVSQFYSLLLPSGVGVSIVRWYQITQNRVGRKIFVVVTLIERAMLSITLLLCAGIPLLFAKDEAIQSFRSSVLPIIFLLLFGCLFLFSFLLHPWVYEKFSRTVRWIQSRIKSGVVGRMLGIYGDIGLYIDKRHLLTKAFVFHLLYQALNFVRFYFVFLALGLDLPFITILWTSTLILLVISVPFSIGGIGVRETGFAWLLGLYGVNPEKGALLGAMISIQFFLNVGIGAVMSIVGAGHSSRECEVEGGNNPPNMKCHKANNHVTRSFSKFNKSGS
ncbi:MAG: lysylphosphatidylglycerol synthase transmembrane domain-containing protein [Desulfobacteraceae bacterium]